MLNHRVNLFESMNHWKNIESYNWRASLSNFQAFGLQHVVKQSQYWYDQSNRVKYSSQKIRGDTIRSSTNEVFVVSSFRSLHVVALSIICLGISTVDDRWCLGNRDTDMTNSLAKVSFSTALFLQVSPNGQASQACHSKSEIYEKMNMKTVSHDAPELREQQSPRRVDWAERWVHPWRWALILARVSPVAPFDSIEIDCPARQHSIQTTSSLRPRRYSQCRWREWG